MTCAHVGLQVLAGPWYFDRKGEIPEGKKPFFEIPVFNYHKVRLLGKNLANPWVLGGKGMVLQWYDITGLAAATRCSGAGVHGVYGVGNMHLLRKCVSGC